MGGVRWKSRSDTTIRRQEQDEGIVLGGAAKKVTCTLALGSIGGRSGSKNGVRGETLRA